MIVDIPEFEVAIAVVGKRIAKIGNLCANHWLFGLRLSACRLTLFGAAQNFSCSFDKRGACLDYGDKVCPQFSKCVSQDAVCLQPHQGNHEGFTCKSNVTELVDDYNDLAGVCRGIQSDLQELRQQYELQSSQIDILLSQGIGPGE